MFTIHYTHERQAARVIMGNAANTQQYSFNPWSLFDYSHELTHPAALRLAHFKSWCKKFFRSLPYYFLHHLLKRCFLRGKNIARFLLIDKKDFWAVALCVYLSIKMSIQRGLGHWKIAPIKKMRSTYLPEALHLPDRREVYKINSGKGCNFSLQLLPNHCFCGVYKRIK